MELRNFAVAFLVFAIALAGCSPQASATSPVPPTVAPTDAVPPTETFTPAPTVSLGPSFTPSPAILDLEILEWSEFPYANPADPSNTDTHVEALIRNPNDFPVRVDTSSDELRFVNSAGDVVYANPSSSFHIWEGYWMLPGETAALSACVCFMSSGLEKQEWQTLELSASLSPTDVVYTLDVEVTMGEMLPHPEVVTLGAQVTLTNTSDQALESIPIRVLAWDTSGRYVGVATSGTSVASFTKDIKIQPGDTASGLHANDINYYDGPMTYEVYAVGIIAQDSQASATEEFVLPSGAPLAEWEGIPVMPGAVSGELAAGGYLFTTQASLDEIKTFYETELVKLGFEVSIDATADYAVVYFQKGGKSGAVAIAPTNGLYAVQIVISP
ncbi:MAG: hypothetical protein IT314_08115 [Anaerolineales bacterium]|nr:hypothetical protein [Anaerolineales bacterium]